MFTRVELMACAGLNEAKKMAELITEGMQVHGDADQLIARHILVELLPSHAWDEPIPDNEFGKQFRAKVCARLVSDWRRRRTRKIAAEVIEEAKANIRSKLQENGLDHALCATVWTHIRG